MTVSLKTMTVKLIGDVLVGSACPAAWLIVTVGYCVSMLKRLVKLLCGWMFWVQTCCPRHLHGDVRDRGVGVGHVEIGPHKSWNWSNR